MPSVHKPRDPAQVQRWLDRIRVGGLRPGLADAAEQDGVTLELARSYLARWHRDEMQTARQDYLIAQRGSGAKRGAPNVPELEQASGPQPPRPGSVAAVLELPPRPFEVPIPSPATMRTVDGVRKAVVIPDAHIPYEDQGAVAIAEAIVKSEQPDALICIGDLLDAGRLSQKFPTDPNRLDTLQDDIDRAKVKLHQWAQLAPNARRVLLEGNHEERLTRLIWGLQGAERELAKLNVVRDNLTWPVMLDLARIGWEWVAYHDQPRADILPHLLVKHGNFVSQEAGMTAKREWQKAGKSGISGHTHRANIWRHKDWNGQATWIEAGCLCDLERTPGAKNPNWQQAVTVIEWNRDGSLMHVEQVLIRDGRALWRGNELTA